MKSRALQGYKAVIRFGQILQDSEQKTAEEEAVHSCMEHGIQIHAHRSNITIFQACIFLLCVAIR
jgi:hypothetical protein